MALGTLHVYGRKSETRSYVSWSYKYNDKLAHLVKATFHPSLWFIAESPLVDHQWIRPFDHSLRSDEWTARLHDHSILGYVGVYVDDLLIAGPRSLNDSLITAAQGVWKTSQPEHLGPDVDCVPVLRFLGMNLERVDEGRSEELNHTIGIHLVESNGIHH